jgi:hypothetical protein
MIAECRMQNAECRESAATGASYEEASKQAEIEVD